MSGEIVFGFAGLVCGWWLRGRLPGALLCLHDRAVRLWWRWTSRHRGGRPRVSAELIALIRQISAENPLWGAPRIHGELLKLGVRVSQSTVSKYMLPRRGRPTQTWETFVRNHASDIAAIDMLTVRSALFECLYAFVVLAHGRRLILHVEVASHPTALWLADEIEKAFAANPVALFLVRDNDGAYGAGFRDRLRAMNICDRPTRPHSPWQNGHVERLIGSIRRECLDHHLILSAGHLRRVLCDYVQYYNQSRTHLALEKDSPAPRAIEARGRIVSHPVLGGLHRRYARRPPK